MSESAEAARSVTGNKSAGVSIGTTDGKSAGVSIGAGGERSAGVTIAAGGSTGTGVTTGGSLGSSVSAAIGAGKSAGMGTARTGAGPEKNAGMSPGASAEKTADKPSVGVSLPESVVSPLIGAGANVYIMTNELTQTMREKLGTSWPFVQDTLNSRYAKLLAGGLLASVAVIVVWKIIKRFSAKVKRPSDSDDDDSYQWNTTRTYELTPVPDVKRQAPRSEGDGYTLPAKIQLRMAEAPLQPNKAALPERCKARDPATRHRLTRHLERRQGEQTAAENHSPWHSEQPHGDDLHCSCPTDLCSSLASRPCLLYSVRESRMERRAMNMSQPNLEDLLTYGSSPSPSTLCPDVLGSVCPHTMSSKSCCLSPHTVSACSPYINLVPRRISEGTSLLPHHHPLFHSPQTDVNILTAPCHLPSYLPHQHGVLQNPLHPGANAGISCISIPYNDGTKADVSWPGGISLSSVGESQPMASASGMTELAGCQTPTAQTEGRSQTVESRARSVSQQTDGQPVEEDLDMPAQLNDTQHTNALQTAHHQSVPTRTAQSYVTPSQCTNTPIRADNSQLHVHSSLTCCSHLSSTPQTFVPTVYQTPQGAVIHLSAGGECPAPYPALHQHAMHFHTQHPTVLDTFSTRTLPTPSQVQTLPSHHVSVSHVLPPSGQQKPTAAKTRQQSEQPVVQHPSDSSMSQNSSEPCTPQDSQQSESGHPTAGSQEMSAPEVLPQERVLLPQQPYSRAGGAGPPLSPPRATSVHHHSSGLRAITDYPQTDYSWQRPPSVHSYQPTPLCVLGYQPPNSIHYSPLHTTWSAPTAMFLTPSPSLFVSSPAGMMAASPSLQGLSTARHWQPPYLYPQTHLTMPRHTSFSPNFNLSNSNAHIFVHEAGQNTMQLLPLPQESSSRITVIGSDHSIHSNTSATATKTGCTAGSKSDISLLKVASGALEVTMSDTNQTSGTAPTYNVQNLQSGDTLITEVATSEENTNLIPLHETVVVPEDADHFHTTDATAEHCEVFQMDPCVVEHVEVAVSHSGSVIGSASTDGMETQL